MLSVARPAVSRPGFTFVELVLVVMVLGIMAGVAVPRYQTALDGVALETTAKRLATNLRYARQEAINQAQTLGIEFLPLAGAYSALTIGGVDISDPDHPGTPLNVLVNQATSRVALQSASFNGAEQITFDFRGDPSASGEVVLTTGARTATVQVSASGEVTVTP